jgi:hypothetical protein
LSGDLGGNFFISSADGLLEAIDFIAPFSGEHRLPLSSARDKKSALPTSSAACQPMPGQWMPAAGWKTPRRRRQARTISG